MTYIIIKNGNKIYNSFILYTMKYGDIAKLLKLCETQWATDSVYDNIVNFLNGDIAKW